MSTLTSENVRLLAAFELSLFSSCYYCSFWIEADHPSGIYGIATASLLIFPFLLNHMRSAENPVACFSKSNQIRAVRSAVSIATACFALLYIFGFVQVDDLFSTRNLRLGEYVLPGSTLLVAYCVYPFFALFQQYVIFRFLLPRISELFCQSPLLSNGISVALFGLSHLPNPQMVVGSLMLGAVCTILFHRHQSIVGTGLLHALVGLMTFTFLDELFPSFSVGRFYLF